MLNPDGPTDSDAPLTTWSLRAAFAAASPRLTPRAMPWVSLLIYLLVLGVWALLFARALWLDNVWAWSAGIVYVLYDTVLTLLVIGLSWPYWRGASAVTDVSLPRPTLGVLIAAHNEATQLPATLDAIFAQSFAPAEVVIADDGSSDHTAAALATRFHLIGDVPVKVGATSLCRYAFPHRGKAEALNAALVRLKADIVVTLDADTRLEPGALQAIADAFAANAKLVAAGGILVPVCDSSPIGRAMQFFQTYEYIRNMISRFAWMRGKCLLLISGAFGAYRRDALLAVGGFDPRCLAEDYELTHRMHRYSIERGLHWDLVMVGGAQAKTEAPPRLAPFLRQRRRWFGGFLQTQYWYRDMTGNRIYGAVGLGMLPIKALDTLQPIYGLLAAALLIALVVGGHGAAALSVGGIIAAKILFDFAAFLWCVRLYRRVTGGRARGDYAKVLLAALLEPWSFQLLRHAGAAWGWIAFLRGSNNWSVAQDQSRAAINAPRAAE